MERIRKTMKVRTKKMVKDGKEREREERKGRKKDL